MNIKQVKSLEGESKTKVLGLTVLLLVVFSAGCLAIWGCPGSTISFSVDE
jgi:hypothetical protein